MFKYPMIILCAFFVLCFSNKAMAGWDFIFSNKGYEKNIEAETYVISEDNIVNVFNDILQLQEIKQESYQNLYGKKIYLLLRLKNKGSAGAWGSLLCKVDGNSIRISINYISFKEWDNYLIPIGKQTWSKSDNIPKVTIEWEKLYSK